MSGVNLKLKGQYVIRKGPSVDEMVEVARFDNIITDAGLKALTTTAFSNCIVGSGNRPPQVTDLTLDNILGTGSYGGPTTPVYTALPEPHVSQSMTCRLNPGVATGNIAEVGVANTTNTSAAGFILFSRALVVDANGDPTVITKLATDYLDVTYTLTVYPSTEDVVQTFDYKGVTTTWTGRVASISNWQPVRFIRGNTSQVSGNMYGESSVLSGITGTPSQGNTGSVGLDLRSSSKLPDVTYRDFTGTIPFSQNTTNNLLKTDYAHTYTSSNATFFFQSEFNPPLLKTDTEALTLTYRVSWGRR